MTLRERYEKETGHKAPLQNCVTFEYVEWLESKLEKPKTKAHLFVDSEYYDRRVFYDTMFCDKYGWPPLMSEYYYNAMKEWSMGETGGVKHKKLDWHLVALAWERKDKRQGTGYYFKKFDKAEEKRKQQIEAMK